MTGLDLRQFRDEVVAPTLKHLDLWTLGREALLLGTACQESGLVYLRQMGSGPALGPFQMEPRTAEDLHLNFLAYRTALRIKVRDLLSRGQSTLTVPDAHEMCWNLGYACAMAACQYARFADPVPDPLEVAELAHTWKVRFNTALGAGTEAQFIRSYAPVMALYTSGPR